MRHVTDLEVAGGVLLLLDCDISVSQADIDNGSPHTLDMIARNPKDHSDQWLVAAQYYVDNLEPVEPESSIEEDIQSKNLTAPRITPDGVKDVIAKTEFHVLADVLTICVITLRNGFTVTGESACASPANFDKEIGERIAHENAIDKIWPLEGYLLKQKLWEEGSSGK